MSEREREVYQHLPPHTLHSIHWLPVFYIFCLLPPLQMLQEPWSFLGISSITENFLARMWELVRSMASCVCTCQRSRTDALRLDANRRFLSRIQSKGDHSRQMIQLFSCDAPGVLPDSFKYQVKREASDAFNLISYDVFQMGTRKARGTKAPWPMMSE